MFRVQSFSLIQAISRFLSPNRIRTKRKPVKVKNDLGVDYKKHEITDRFPTFNKKQTGLFIKRGLIPLSEIRYWLDWSNKLRKDPEESPDLAESIPEGTDPLLALSLIDEGTPRDYPTGKAILGFLHVVLKNYGGKRITEEKLKNIDLRPDWAQKINAVPLADFENFLSQFESEPDRKEIIKKLDAFVGQYIK